jgi:hypothetical protein
VPTPVTGARPLPAGPLTLAATRITEDVRECPRAVVGRVLSAYRAAIYIDQPAPDGLLVVAIEDVGGVPGGILVPGVDDLRRIGLWPGMTVVGSPNGLALAIPAADLTIELSRAESWSPTLPSAARFGPSTDLAATAAAVRRVALSHSPPGGLAPMLSGSPRADDPWFLRARAAIGQQLERLGRGDTVAALGPTVDLLGLGIGLTPSGDDYLVGLLAGMEAAGDPARFGLAEAIGRQAPARTTAISAASLRHAARGAFSERLHDLLLALARGDVAGLETPIRRVMAYGATSGTDTLVGLLAALDLAAGRSARSRPAQSRTVAA